MAIKCIDVSDHQGKINWKKVKKSGINYAIIRAGYGKNNIDSQFANNIKGAIAAGIEHLGIYWFSYAYTTTMATAEANYCDALIKSHKDKLDLGVYFDWEYDSMRYAKKMKVACGKTQITNMTNAFCKRIESLGYIPGFYYNYDYKAHYYDLKALPYVNWYALGKSNGEYKTVAIQQYGVESVPGISGKVDMNWVHKNPKEDFAKSVAKVVDTPAVPARGYFKLGDKDPDVRWIQKKLNAKNKMSDSNVMKKLGYQLEVDGIFGEATKKAVKLFQDVSHIKVDGRVGAVTLRKLETVKVTAIRRAINFAVAIARDNSFAYGTGARAHHNGCYFCGTNITGPKKAKKGSKWEKTYCCNPFIHAAYAHGAGDEKMLKACKKASAAGLVVKDWEKFGFKKVGACSKVKFSDLKMGDVILKKGKHVYMYTGSGYFVEASGGTFEDSSIAHKKTAKKRYAEYSKRKDTYVLRYKG